VAPVLVVLRTKALAQMRFFDTADRDQKHVKKNSANEGDTFEPLLAVWRSAADQPPISRWPRSCYTTRWPARSRNVSPPSSASMTPC
jgi:hypothetical protein